MCGIFGFSRITETTRAMAPMLAWEMEDRGHDSWGATDGLVDIKHLGPITRTWRSEWDNWAGWERGIFHTRAASTGAVTLENQHPFRVVVTDDKKQTTKTVIGIHNGIVANHETLNRKYSRSFDCDTPHIFCAIAGFSPTTEIHGYGNLAWYETTPDSPTPLLHLLHFNARNLFIAKLDTGEVVFCSNKEPIDRAAAYAGTKVDKHFFTEGDKIYTVERDFEGVQGSDMLCNGPKLAFGGRSVQVSNNGSYNGTPWVDARGGRLNTVFPLHPDRSSRRTNISELGGKDRRDNICLKNLCENKVKSTRRHQILCETCFAEVMENVEAARLSKVILMRGGSE